MWKMLWAAGGMTHEVGQCGSQLFGAMKAHEEFARKGALLGFTHRKWYKRGILVPQQICQPDRSF